MRSNSGKFRSFGPYDITIGRGTRFMDVFVTDANLKDAAVQFYCKLAIHSDSTVVSWCSGHWQNSICLIKLRAALSLWLRANWGQRGRAGVWPAPRDYNFNLRRWRNIRLERRVRNLRSANLRRQQRSANKFKGDLFLNPMGSEGDTEELDAANSEDDLGGLKREPLLPIG